MNQIWKMNALIFIILLWTTLSWAEDDFSLDEQAVEFLEDFDFDELREIEVSLDEVFDVFDGLLKKRRTKVASGLKQSTDRAPAVTSVITAQDIEVMGARTLDEILRTVPGLQVSYTWYNIPIYSIRGISSTINPEILVLLNGIRLNDSYSGSKGYQWGGFQISAIQRIEIIRGPGSAVYGAEAFAGVINIVTKSAQDINGTEAGIRLGNLNTQDVWVLHGSQWHGFDVAVMAEFDNTDGHQRIVESDAQTVFDQMFGTNASLAPGPFGSQKTDYSLNLDIEKQHWRFRAGWHNVDSMGGGAGNAQALDPGDPISYQRANVDLTYANPTISKNWGLETEMSYLHHQVDNQWQLFPPGAFGGAYPIGYLGYPSGSQAQTQFKIQGTYRGLSDHLIRTGIGYGYYDMYEVKGRVNFGPNPFTGGQILPTELVDVSDTFAVHAPEVSRNNWYGFLQDTWTINAQWELTGGIRYDKYSDFGSTTNPRLGLVWQPKTGFTTKLLYGKAFRSPSFQELYNRNNPVAIGNENLGPEEIQTWELAFDYFATDVLHFALNLYRYDIEDKITTVPIGPTEASFANADSWKGQGGEFELRWKTSNKSSLLFNYSYQDSKDKTTNVTLPNASKQVAYLRADYLIGSQWYLDAQMNWNDGRTRVVNDPRPDLDGYTTTDLILRRKDIRGGHINFALGIHNLFDTDVRYPSPGPDPRNNIVNLPNDLPGGGRFYFVEFRYKF